MVEIPDFLPFSPFSHNRGYRSPHPNKDAGFHYL